MTAVTSAANLNMNGSIHICTMECTGTFTVTGLSSLIVLDTMQLGSTTITVYLLSPVPLDIHCCGQGFGTVDCLVHWIGAISGNHVTVRNQEDLTVLLFSPSHLGT